MNIDGIPVIREDEIAHLSDNVEYDFDVVQAGPFAMRWLTLLNAGDICVQHVHAHDHATIVTKGRIRAYIEGRCLGDFGEGEAIHVVANERHYMEALVPNSTFWCVHYLPGE